MSEPFKPFQRVVIVGVGLLGASLGLALKARKLAGRVVGVGRAATAASSSLRTALGRGAIDEAHADLAAAAVGADLVVLCTPVRQFPAAPQQLAGVLAPGAIVTDVGSTKGQIMAWAAEILPPQVRFVGSHPMAGSEQKGPGAAREDLYEGAACLVCRPLAEGEGRKTAGEARNADPAAARVAALWRALGMRVMEVDAAAHDRWVAAISHLPHAAAFTLVNAAAADPACLRAIAGGFMDTTRIAMSDVEMWVDIFLTNRTALGQALGDFERRLGALRTAIETGDEAAIRRALSDAKSVREGLADPRRKSAE